MTIILGDTLIMPMSKSIKVSVKSELPLTGEENEIVLISEVQTENFFISNSEPTASEGDVWIVSGEEGEHSIQFGKDSKSKIILLGAQQKTADGWSKLDGYVWVEGKWVQFSKQGMALRELSAGTLVKVPVKQEYQSLIGEYVNYKIAAKNHEGYPEGSVTMVSEKLIAMFCYDAKEPTGGAEPMQYGNNRYIYSNIHQWLNSNAKPGQWYSPAYEDDAPPISANTIGNINPYNDWPGFLEMFDDEFSNKMISTTFTVARSTTVETFDAKVTLPSRTEVGMGNESSYAEGSQLELFSSQESCIAKCSDACISNSDYSSNPTSDQGWFWWLRTPYRANTANVRMIKEDGNLQPNYSYNQAAALAYPGIRPLFNWDGNVLVSPTPNPDGSYNLIL